MLYSFIYTPANNLILKVCFLIQNIFSLTKWLSLSRVNWQTIPSFFWARQIIFHKFYFHLKIFSQKYFSLKIFFFKIFLGETRDRNGTSQETGGGRKGQGGQRGCQQERKDEAHQRTGIIFKDFL